MANAATSAEVGGKLKRERAGTYRTADGRFTVEQTSSGWLVLDAEQADELGLPLARGPFATLDAARASIDAARSGPAPSSGVTDRVRPSGRAAPVARRPIPVPSANAPARIPAPKPAPPIIIRELRLADGDTLRRLWTEAGFRVHGDDDRGLARMVRRNPGLVLVAVEGTRIVGSALGGWDGRRGWIYHLATVATHRRQGIATRLVARIEAGLFDLGCPKVNVLVQGANGAGREFWIGRGYVAGTAKQFGKEL